MRRHVLLGKAPPAEGGSYRGSGQLECDHRKDHNKRQQTKDEGASKADCAPLRSIG